MFTGNNKVGAEISQPKISESSISTILGAGSKKHRRLSSQADFEQHLILANQSSQLSNAGGQQPQLSLISLSLVLPVQSRRVRDSGSFFVFVLFLAFLFYVIWDCVVVKQVDVNLVIHGHDSYGNICGRNNKPIPKVLESGKNYTSKPFTRYALVNNQFERYTLVESRLGTGREVLLVKESERLTVKNLWKNLPSVQHSTALQRRQANSTQQLARIKRLANTDGGFPFRAVAANKKLQPKLLYRMPRLPTSKDSSNEERDESSTLQQSAPRGQFKDIQVQSGGGSGSGSGNGKRRVSSDALEAAASMADNVLGELPAPSDSNSAASRNSTGSVLNSVAQHYASSRGNSKPPHQWPPLTTSTFSPTSTPSSIVGGSRPLAEPSNSTLLRPTNSSSSMDEVQLENDHVIVDQNSKSRPPASSIDNRNDQGHFYSTSSSNDDSNNNNGIDGSDIDLAHRDSHGYGGGLNLAPTNTQLWYLSECVDVCPSDYLELIFYRCMPRNWRFALFPSAINVTTTFIEDILADLGHCQKELLYVFSIGLVMSLTLLILLRYLATFIIWSCISMLLTLLISMASYSWLNYYYIIMDLNNSLPAKDKHYVDKLSSSDRWLLGSIFLTFITIAAIATIAFMRKRILMVTSLFRESGKAIADMPMLLLQPVLTFASLCIITFAWGYGLICLQSVKMPVIDPTTGFVVFKAETLYKVMKWYHVFAYLWVSHFAIACQHYVIGASVSKWYFSTDRYNLSSPIGSSVSELILYYLGSVALGSFLVAIFRIIRIIIRQIQALMHRNCMSSASGSGGGSNSNGTSPIETIAGANDAASRLNSSPTSCCGSFSCITRLFVWFVDNIIMVINRDAYVEISIYGGSFLQSAKRAFNVMANNPIRLIAIKTVGSSLLTVAKICVVLGTVCVAVFLMNDLSSQLKHWWAPIAVSALYAYIVAHWFLSVYDMVIDALFICYCEDLKRMKGDGQTSNRLNGSTVMTRFVDEQQNVAAA